MSTIMMSAEDGSLFATLDGIPKVDFPTNLQAAVSAGRRMSSILAEVVSLRCGPGKLTLNEYFYYRLWDPNLTCAVMQRHSPASASKAGVGTALSCRRKRSGRRERPVL